MVSAPASQGTDIDHCDKSRQKYEKKNIITPKGISKCLSLRSYSFSFAPLLPSRGTSVVTHFGETAKVLSASLDITLDSLSSHPGLTDCSKEKHCYVFPILYLNNLRDRIFNGTFFAAIRIRQQPRRLIMSISLIAR